MESSFSDISPGVDDICAIELHTHGRPISIVSYYCPPDAGQDLASTELQRFVDTYDSLIVAGDLNATHSFYGSKRTNHRGDQLFDFVERNDLVVCIKEDQFTRHVVSTGHTETLDYFIASRRPAGLVSDIFVGEDVGSDHLPLHLKLQLRYDIKRAPMKEVHILSKCDWQLFHDRVDESIRALSDRPLTDEQAIDEQCIAVSSAIAVAFDEACPKRQVKEWSFRVSRATLALIRLKRKLRRKSQKSDNPEYRTLYNNVARQVKANVEAEKKRLWEEATQGLEGKRGRAFWSTFKMLMGVNS